MYFISTRGGQNKLTASQAILKGFDDDDGLFAPENFIKITKDDFTTLCECNYAERAAIILHKFFDDFSFEFLLDACTEVYSSFIDNDPAPLVAVNPNEFFLELHHGKSCSNKDLSVGLLPHLINEALRINAKNKEYTAVCLDNVDTCKAAMNSFKDIQNAKLICFSTTNDATQIQKLQLATNHGANTYVAEYIGDYNLALSELKKIIADNKNIVIADSCNIACVAAQTVYYISAYCDLINTGTISLGDKVNFVLPVESGTELLSCLYAKKMGLHIDKIIFSSEEDNCVLDLVSTGKVNSLNSNNFERILFEFTCRNGKSIRELIEKTLENNNVKLEGIKFVAKDFCPFDHTFEDIVYSISYYFDEYCYLLDKKTAAAIAAKAEYYGDEVEEGIFINVATTSPFKFAEDLFLTMFEGGYDSIYDAICDIADEAVTDIPAVICELESLNKDDVSKVFD